MTVPLAFAVYVPSPGTVNVVPVHDPVDVDVVHTFTLEAVSVAPDDALSLVKGLIV
ncbi:hypothetical protein AINA4_01510 [Aurantimicrobium sp. INA4]|nr:hypothetical protein AINA4_01510 [Aurantimicrobium sp. INA4]